MEVWALILMMWTVPTVEDGGSYATYRTRFLELSACQSSREEVLKTATPHMTVVCLPEKITRDQQCAEVVGFKGEECPDQ